MLCHVQPQAGLYYQPALYATPLTEAFTICTNDHIMQHHQRSGSRRVVEAQLAFLQLELYFRNRVAAVQRVAINTKCRYCFFSWLGLDLAWHSHNTRKTKFALMTLQLSSLVAEACCLSLFQAKARMPYCVLSNT